MRVCPRCRLRYEDDTVFCLVDGEALETLSDPRIGTVVGGRYTLVDVLGRGGMATVYAAQEEGGRPVAIKVLHDELADDEVLRTRFAREAQATAQLAHPNIVEIYDVGMTAENVPFLAMELLDGVALDQLLLREGALGAARVIAFGLQIARGLARAHDFGLVHRDVKPENVIVCRADDGAAVVKIVDFGIALAPGDPRLTKRDDFLGSPRYTAPERFWGNASTPSTDLYALGVVLFEMAAGRPPFESETLAGYLTQHLEAEPPPLRSLAPELPAPLAELVHGLLAKDPAWRPPDAHAVVEKLAALATVAQRRVRRVSTLETTLERRAGGSLRLGAWAERAAAYGEMLDRAFGESPPPALADHVAELQGTVARLRALQVTTADLSERSREAMVELQHARERLGHAVEVLAKDLSERRREAGRQAVPGGFVGGWADAYRSALALAIELDVREPEVPTEDGRAALRDALTAYEGWLESTEDEVLHDLEYQLSALRSTLDKKERDVQDERARLTAGLEANGEQQRRLEARLLELARHIDRALRPRPELADHFARLERAGARHVGSDGA
ncbi:MAG: protein kinase [Myxococcota bacterium]